MSHNVWQARVHSEPDRDLTAALKRAKTPFQTASVHSGNGRDSHLTATDIVPEMKF